MTTLAKILENEKEIERLQRENQIIRTGRATKLAIDFANMLGQHHEKKFIPLADIALSNGVNHQFNFSYLFKDNDDVTKYPDLVDELIKAELITKSMHILDNLDRYQEIDQVTIDECIADEEWCDLYYGTECTKEQFFDQFIPMYQCTHYVQELIDVLDL